jgi:hypothetical protein
VAGIHRLGGWKGGFGFHHLFPSFQPLAVTSIIVGFQPLWTQPWYPGWPWPYSCPDSLLIDMMKCIVVLHRPNYMYTPPIQAAGSSRHSVPRTQSCGQGHPARPHSAAAQAPARSNTGTIDHVCEAAMADALPLATSSPCTRSARTHRRAHRNLALGLALLLRERRRQDRVVVREQVDEQHCSWRIRHEQARGAGEGTHASVDDPGWTVPSRSQSGR